MATARPAVTVAPLPPRADVKSLSAALETAQRGSFDVFSVDVFDTLLLRDATLQRQRFAEVASELAKRLSERQVNIDPRTLLSLRHRLHRIAYQAVSIERPHGDATLRQLCQTQISLLGLSQELLPVFMAAELDVERRHLAPNRPLVRLMESLRSKGIRVIAVSDMYLDGAAIEQLVVTVAGVVPVDRIYVSCDLGMTKHSGTLFAKVAELESVALERIVHVGDNRHSDYTMAVSAGCQATMLERSGWMRLLRAASALQAIVRGP